MKTLLVSLGIAFALVGVQLVGYFVTRSLVVAFDALHMFIDMGVVGIGIFAIWLARRPATGARSWGYLRVEILGALVNGALMIGMTLLLVKEVFDRLTQHHATPELEPKYMFIFGGIALGANLVNLLVLQSGHGGHDHGEHDHGEGEGHAHEDEADHDGAGHTDLNYQGVFLHALSDVLGSLGVLLAAAIIHFTGWAPADSVIALVMSAIVLGRTVYLCIRAVDVLLESTPSHVDVTDFEAALRRVEAVKEVHDLHIWTLTSGVYAMSCHALVGPGADHRRVLGELNAVIRERFGIDHTTIQLEDQGEPAVVSAS
jgi:cobalt-zinc-cadmium efflux system protein